MAPWSFSELILYLTAYSALGWCFESLFCTIFIDHKWVNRGFLTGPCCPIYGFGAVGVLWATQRLTTWPALVFVVALALTSTLEYATSWVMEKLFDMRWWDYSHCKFNIQGRVCLKNALFFGVMSLGVVYGLHPPVRRLVDRIAPDYQRLFATAIVALFVLDLLHTLGAVSKMRERVQSLRDYLAELERMNEEAPWFDRRDIAGSIERLRALCAEDAGNERAAAILASLDSLTGRRPREWRIVHNARMQIEGMQASLEGLRTSWELRREKDRARSRDRKARLKAGTREVLGSLNPRREGLTFYRLVLIFTVASVAGYLLETGYHFLNSGLIESRQGMLYGPFNQVYGFGAVLMTWVLAPLAKKRGRWVFVGGAVVGGLFEVACSLVQEALFHTVSWRYTGSIPFFGGRTNLLYMTFWGILAVVFIKGIYPNLCGLLDRIPKRQTAALAWLMVAVLSVNLLMSAVAVGRWTERQRGVPAENGFARYLDERFPDEMLEKIYPNMVLTEHLEAAGEP